MKKVISRNKFLSTICAFGLVLMLGCAMMLSACATYTTGELKLAKGAPYGFDIDSTELTLTGVAPSTLVTTGDTNVYDFGIKVTGAVEAITPEQFAIPGFTAETDEDYLVVFFTLTITEEMMADPDAKIKTDSAGILDQVYNLSEAIDVAPLFGYDGFVGVVLNTADDNITHIALEYKKAKADGTGLEATATTIKYIIDLTGVTKAVAPVAP